MTLAAAVIRGGDHIYERSIITHPGTCPSGTTRTQVDSFEYRKKKQVTDKLPLCGVIHNNELKSVSHCTTY